MNEKGFALPMTLFLVTILTVMLTSAFTRVSSEIQIASGAEAGVDALAVAQSGLHSYFGSDFSSRPASGDSTRINVAGGYAWVVPEALQTPADTTDDYTFVVRSTGYVIDADQGATPLGSRTIAQLARWQTGHITELAALTTASGVDRRNNGYVAVHGQDLICGTGESVPHTRTYAGDGNDYSLNYWSGTGVVGVQGSPPNPPNPPPVQSGTGGALAGLVESGTQQSLAESLNMDWELINSGGFDADYTTFRAWDATYPVIVIIGDYTATTTGGYGVLVVTGQLDTQGDYFYWEGPVLAGGRARFRALNNWVYGAVVTGMDKQLGENESETEVGGHYSPGVDRSTYIYYAPCIIDVAMRSLNGFIPLQNTWVGNWATY